MSETDAVSRRSLLSSAATLAAAPAVLAQRGADDKLGVAKDPSLTFACTFHNKHHGTSTYIFGREATLEVETAWCRLYGAEWKPEHTKKLAAARAEAKAAGSTGPGKKRSL